MDQTNNVVILYPLFSLNTRLNLCQSNPSLKTCSFCKAGPLS